MRAEDRHKISGLLVDLFACFLLPAYTLLFAGSVEWFGTNFSVRAVLGENYYWGFVVWGLLAGSYFFVMLTRLTFLLRGVWTRLGLLVLILAACLSLANAIAIPYLPQQIPRWADLHVLLASGACVLVRAVLLVLILRLGRERNKPVGPLLAAWLVIVLVSGVLFALAGMVSSALEIFFAISAALLIRALWLRSH